MFPIDSITGGRDKFRFGFQGNPVKAFLEELIWMEKAWWRLKLIGVRAVATWSHTPHDLTDYHAPF
jgi:hypothetical protein